MRRLMRRMLRRRCNSLKSQGTAMRSARSERDVIRDTLSSCMERHAAGDVARRVVAALRSAGYSILPTAEPGTERVPHPARDE
jgi:hypothetical protein